MAAVALVPLNSPPRSPLDRIKAIVLDSVPSEHTKRAYGQALDGFLCWFQAQPLGELTKAAVNSYRTKLEADGLSPASVRFRIGG
jgi:hypothetical protein